MDANTAALKALKDIGRIIRDFLPPSSEITAEEAMEEIIAVMDRNSVAKLTQRAERTKSFAYHSQHEH